jgi:hypothetical protein
MPSHAVSLDEKHFRVAEEKARALGKTPDEYVRQLIDIDLLSDQSFDQLLAPVRKGFEHLSDVQLEALFADAKKWTSRA